MLLSSTLWQCLVMKPRRERQTKPLDQARLSDLALHYVARYATTRHKLLVYLARKVRERGWGEDGSPDLEAVADRLVELRYIDDTAYAHSKANSLKRRGLGERRISTGLRASGIAGDLASAVSQTEADEAMMLAAVHARRKRIGPFADSPGDDRIKARWFGSLLRAGHRADQARALFALSRAEAEQVANGVKIL